MDEVALRDVSTDDFLALMTPCLVPETRPETIVLLPFNHSSVRATIHEAKYHGSAHAFNLLALALADYLRDADEGFRKPIIAPIPLGKRRKKERGFNQVEEVARRAGKELGVAVNATLLERTRETASQVSLQRRAREENMRGAFRAAHPVDPTYIYIVIDDVVTTGATLQAAIDALREAGAEHIVPLALAH
ncbi:MAG: ComF family protein [Minisyncoccota bacterium]